MRASIELIGIEFENAFVALSRHFLRGFLKGEEFLSEVF